MNLDRLRLAVNYAAVFSALAFAVVAARCGHPIVAAGFLLLFPPGMLLLGRAQDISWRHRTGNRGRWV